MEPQSRFHSLKRVPCYAPMLDKSMAMLDFTQSAVDLHHRVLGLNPWPVALTLFGGKRLKIYRVSVLEGSGEPGTAFVGPDKSFCVYCGKGALRLDEIQPENKKRMSGADFLLGHPLNSSNSHLG